MEIFVSSSFEKIKLTKIDSNLKSIHMHVLNLKSVSIQNSIDWLDSVLRRIGNISVLKSYTLICISKQLLPYDSCTQSFSKFPEPDGAVLWPTDTILLVGGQNNTAYAVSMTLWNNSSRFRIFIYKTIFTCNSYTNLTQARPILTLPLTVY